MDAQAGLLVQYTQQLRMPVPKCIDANTGNEVEIPLPAGILQIAALAALHQQWTNSVGWQEVSLFHVSN